MSSALILEAADRLQLAAHTKHACSPVRDLLAGMTNPIEFAYEIQELNTNRAIAEGRKLIGRKIGLTSLKVQAQLGVDEPDYGMLFADMLIDNRGLINAGDLLQPKIEAEIALIMASNIDDPNITPDQLLSNVDRVVAALEIVDSRIANWDIRLIDTIADNASSGLFVFGNANTLPSKVDWTGCGMKMNRASAVVSEGSGAECMGNPLIAATWVARKMIATGRPIAAGDCILTGALGPMATVRRGDRFEADVLGLGLVSVDFC